MENQIMQQDKGNIDQSSLVSQDILGGSDDLRRKYEELENKYRDLNSKIDETKTRVVETIAIFVALFTFVSVEFQAFRLENNVLFVAGITLIMLGGLVLFLSVLDIYMHLSLSIYRYSQKEGAFISAISSIVGGREQIELRLS